MQMHKPSNMILFIIFMLTVSVLLAALTWSIFRSNQSLTPSAANAAALSSQVENPLFVGSSRREQRRRHDWMLFIAGLRIPPRTSNKDALQILQGFLADRFGLLNNVCEVIKYIPGVSAKRSIMIAKVDGLTFHQVLLWKNLLLRGTSISVDVPRKQMDLRRRYSTRMESRESQPPGPRSIARRPALAPATNPTQQAPNLAPDAHHEPGPSNANVTGELNEQVGGNSASDSPWRWPDQEFSADCILEQRKVGRRVEYLVKFTGFDTPEWCKAQDVGSDLKAGWWAAHPEFRPTPRQPRVRDAQPASPAILAATNASPQPIRRSSRVASRAGGGSQASH